MELTTAWTDETADSALEMALEASAVTKEEKYESGQSIRLLAESSGRSYGFVHRILTESGATLRGRGGATRKKPA